MEKILGTSSMSKGNKTTIIKRVVEKLDLKVGDLLIFVESDNGVTIRKG